MLVTNVWGDGAHTDAHSTDKYESIELLPLRANICSQNGFGTKFTLERLGDCTASLADLYNGYLLHFNIVMG